MLIALFATLLACSTTSSDVPATTDAVTTESVMPASQDQSATQLEAVVASPCSDVADDGHCLDAETSDQVPSTAIPVASPASQSATVVVNPAAVSTPQ